MTLATIQKHSNHPKKFNYLILFIFLTSLVLGILASMVKLFVAFGAFVDMLRQGDFEIYN